MVQSRKFLDFIICITSLFQSLFNRREVDIGRNLGVFVAVKSQYWAVDFLQIGHWIITKNNRFVNPMDCSIMSLCSQYRTDFGFEEDIVTLRPPYPDRDIRRCANAATWGQIPIVGQGRGDPRPSPQGKEQQRYREGSVYLTPHSPESCPQHLPEAQRFEPSPAHEPHPHLGRIQPIKI